MLKKTITFEDLDGNEVTEDYYFHLSQAELVKIRLSHGGDLEAYFRTILAEQDAEKIMAAFDEIILATVGRRSPDGKRFEKDNGRIAQEFKETDAYSVLFTELLTEDGKNFQAFFTAVVPNKLQGKVQESLKVQDTVGAAAEKLLSAESPPFKFKPEGQLSEAAEKILGPDDRPSWVKENRDPTQAELFRMTSDEFALFIKNRK